MNRIILALSFLLFTICISCGNNGNKKLQPTNGVFADPSILPISKEIDANPANAALFFKRGKAFRSLQQDSIALLDFQEAIKLDSSKAPYFSAIGELLFENKEVDGSVTWFKKAIEIDPLDPIAHLKFAKMLIYVNDNQKAFNEINVVLRKDPYNAEAYFLKGVVYKNLNDTNKAISSFTTSVQVDPGYQPSIMQLALIYAVKNDSIALRYFDNAYNADTTQLMALYGKALFYQDNNQFEKAKEIYKKCIARNPHYFDAHFNTGWILMHQDSLEKATKEFDIAIKIDPGNYKPYYNRGLCYELLQRPDLALTDYQYALQANQDYKEAKEGVKRVSK